MAETTQQIVTTEWQKVSDGDCTIQSMSKMDLYNVAIGAAVPTDIFLILELDEIATFGYKSPVWIKLNDARDPNLERTIVIVK